MPFIRTFRPSDLQDIAVLADRTLGENYNPGIYTAVHQTNPEGFIVCHEGNDLIGFAVAVPEENDLRILMLSIHERYRRRGIGSSMLKELVSRFLAKGFKKLVLEVREGNDGAIEFYRNRGFEIESMIPNYYSTGESAYRMTRVIG